MIARNDFITNCKKMNKSDYDNEELELIDFIENGNPESIPNTIYEIEQLKNSARAKLNERNLTDFIKMLASIEPIKIGFSSEKMIEMLREGKEQELLDIKNNNAK